MNYPELDFDLADPKVVADVTDDDRRWFLSHKKRKFRIRFGRPGEFPFCTPENVVIVVVQVVPGSRVRVQVGHSTDPKETAKFIAKSKDRDAQDMLEEIGWRLPHGPQ